MLMTPSGSRSQEFGMGSGPTEPPSLQSDQQRWNQMVPGKFKPNGLNQQIQPSNDGYSDKDAQRITPNGVLQDVFNGASAGTAQKLQPKYGTTLNLTGA